MRISIHKKYNHTAELWNWENPIDLGMDQYEAEFRVVGPINCFFGVDPATGRLTVYVPVLLPVKTPMINAPKNQHGIALGPQDLLWRCGPPIPSMNAYGQISSYRYNLIEGDK